jgi:hypothetical protein
MSEEGTTMGIACPPTLHRHEPLACFRCGTTDRDAHVYARLTASGDRQPALCGHCAHKMDRIRRLERVS